MEVQSSESVINTNLGNAGNGQNDMDKMTQDNSMSPNKICCDKSSSRQTSGGEKSVRGGEKSVRGSEERLEVNNSDLVLSNGGLTAVGGGPQYQLPSQHINSVVEKSCRDLSLSCKSLESGSKPGILTHLETGQNCVHINGEQLNQDTEKSTVINSGACTSITMAAELKHKMQQESKDKNCVLKLRKNGGTCNSGEEICEQSVVNGSTEHVEDTPREVLDQVCDDMENYFTENAHLLQSLELEDDNVNASTTTLQSVSPNTCTCTREHIGLTASCTNCENSSVQRKDDGTEMCNGTCYMPRMVNSSEEQVPQNQKSSIPEKPDSSSVERPRSLDLSDDHGDFIETDICYANRREFFSDSSQSGSFEDLQEMDCREPGDTCTSHFRHHEASFNADEAMQNRMFEARSRFQDSVHHVHVGGMRSDGREADRPLTCSKHTHIDGPPCRPCSWTLQSEDSLVRNNPRPANVHNRNISGDSNHGRANVGLTINCDATSKSTSEAGVPMYGVTPDSAAYFSPEMDFYDFDIEPSAENMDSLQEGSCNNGDADFRQPLRDSQDGCPMLFQHHNVNGQNSSEVKLSGFTGCKHCLELQSGPRLPQRNSSHVDSDNVFLGPQTCNTMDIDAGKLCDRLAKDDLLQHYNDLGNGFGLPLCQNIHHGHQGSSNQEPNNLNEVFVAMDHLSDHEDELFNVSRQTSTSNFDQDENSFQDEEEELKSAKSFVDDSDRDHRNATGSDSDTGEEQPPQYPERQFAAEAREDLPVQFPRRQFHFENALGLPLNANAYPAMLTPPEGAYYYGLNDSPDEAVNGHYSRPSISVSEDESPVSAVHLLEFDFIHPESLNDRDRVFQDEPIYEEIRDVHLASPSEDFPGSSDSSDDKQGACAPMSDIHFLTMLQEKGRRGGPPPLPARSSIEKVMIWSEYEAYVLQVKQLGTSACGPTAVVNVLKALDFYVDKTLVCETVRANLRAESASVPEYLFSRSVAGTTAHELIEGIEKLTENAIHGRFFDMYPARDVELRKWLGKWIKKGAVPLVTLNLQKAVYPGCPIPDAWHHQMVYGVGPKGVYLTNPLEVVPEEIICDQLRSDSVLLVRRDDILTRWTSDCDLSLLLCHPDDCWREMNVLGQVVNVLREAHMVPLPVMRPRPRLTSHVTIPAVYKSGVTLFVRTDAEVHQDLLMEPQLPLKSESPS